MLNVGGASALLTAPSGRRLHATVWKPGCVPRGQIVICHGYAEYVGRYADAARRWTDLGFAVVGVDYPGHGQSEGERKRVPPLDEIARDLNALLADDEFLQGDAPVILFGHSMGSLIALEVALEQPRRYAGLIISGCALGAVDHVPAIGIRLLKVLARRWPAGTLVPGIDSQDLACDPTIARDYDADPLIPRGRWRNDTLVNIVAAIDDVRARLGKLSLPLLILHGRDDQILPASGAVELFDRAGSETRRLHILAGMRHELLADFGSQAVWHKMASWLEAILPGRHS